PDRRGRWDPAQSVRSVPAGRERPPARPRRRAGGRPRSGRRGPPRRPPAEFPPSPSRPTTYRPWRPLGSLLLVRRHSHHDGRRAGVGLAGRTQAPDRVVVALGARQRPLTLHVVAEAPVAGRFPAAVVIGDDVVAVVGGVAAGADPGDRRHLGAGRTGVHGPPAAGAEKAVDRAVAPVIAGVWIARILRIGHGRRARRRGRGA